MRPVIAVFGAYGHTGKFVVAELLRRGITAIAVGRDSIKLASCGFVDQGVETRVAALNDPKSLETVLYGVDAVINCAGPFLDTAQPLVEAALSARVHYLDVTAEQMSALSTLERFNDRAKDQSVAVVPAAGFYGGLGDLAATAAMSDWTHADDVSIAIALDSWHPTHGTRRTGQRNTAARLVVSGGALQPQEEPRSKTRWNFAEPFGVQEVVELPFTETILLERHLHISSVHNYINMAPLRDLNEPSTPAPVPADESGRSPQLFLLEAVVRKGNVARCATVSGRDIYAVTAPLVVEAAELLVKGAFHGSGAMALAEVGDARTFLQALCPQHLAFIIQKETPLCDKPIEPRYSTRFT